MRLLGRHVPTAFLMLGLVEFASAALAFALMFAAARSIGLELSIPTDWQLVAWAMGFGFAAVVGMLAMGLYYPRQRLRIEGIVARQIVGLLVGTILLALIDLIFEIEIPGTVWVASVVLVLVFFVVIRLAFERVVDQEVFRRRVLVLGAGERASSLLELRRKSDQRGFRLVAFIPDRGDKFTLDDPRVAQSTESLLERASAEQITEIVVAMDDRRKSFPVADLLECRFAGIEIVDIVHFLERETGRVKIDLVTPDWMIFSGGFTASALRDFVLRALDLLIVTVTAVVTLPLMAIVAIAILLEDRRPIFYHQVRVGLRGKNFVLLKFRSMVKDAESEGEARWAKAGDPRVTHVGSVIRKYRLDELPQLLNVVRGDMSLVGPRPERPEFIERLTREIPYYNERHCVKPGITGWAQMCYPYGASDEDARAKLAYDLYYVKHRSLIFNLAVMLQTAEVVLWAKGSR